ncbi:hypothetical protein BKA61DRAFT_711424 [Leptodontidium sp. MPI-SDFR-AT-0119]|nr:hypothetical protein BKA61DRAFT_711424 [Leptodontidium sp. MPI-SDFR-AT-0119]
MARKWKWKRMNDVHGRAFHPRIWSSLRQRQWTRLQWRNGSSDLAWAIVGTLQLLLVYWCNCCRLGRLRGQYNAEWMAYPHLLPLIVSSLIFIFVWFLPESPQWLISQGRNESARAILARYHGEGDPDHPIVKLQMAEMEFQISTEGSDKRRWDYNGLSGNSVTSYYLPVMLENAGITSQSRKLFLNGIDTPLCFVASVTGTMFLDKAGRRPLLIWRIHTHPDNSYAANSSIAFIYIFGIIFSFAWTPLSPMYVVECLHTNTRAKGKALAQLFTDCASVVIQYASGPAFQHIKYYFYIAFNGWDVIELVVIYFFWPETKDRTLEELDEWFQAPNPVTKILEPRGMSIVFNTLNIETKHSKFEDY